MTRNFEGDFVHVRRDPLTGDVILSQNPVMTWEEFKALQAELGSLELPLDRNQGDSHRDPFEGWTE